MRSNWVKKTIGSLCTITRGASPRPIQKYYTDKGIHWIKISDATASNSRYIEKTTTFIQESGKSKSIEVFLGDLIVSNSATPALPRIVGLKNACIHDGWLLLRNFKDFDKMYACYLIDYIRPQLLHLGNGSVFTNLKTEMLKDFEISLPSLAEQKSIAEILTSLDDKIKNLTKQNITLESINQTLFKPMNSDLVLNKERRKMTIKDTLDTSFEQQNEVENIPEGWTKIPCLEYLKFKKGVEPGVKNYIEKHETETTDELIPFIRVGDLQKRSSETYVKKNMFADHIVKDDNILISLDGNVGIVTRGVEGVVSSGIRTVTDIQDKATPYVYAYLKSPSFLEDLERFTPPATTIVHAGKALNSIEMIKAPTEVIDNFNNILEPCFQKILNNLREIDQLQKTRDYLLPRLLSGQIIPLIDEEGEE